MSWLGQNGSSRDDFYALADAYKAMYSKQELKEDPAEEEVEEIEEGKVNDPISQALKSDKKLMKLHTKDKPAPKGYVKEGALNDSHINPNVQAKPSMDADSNLNKPYSKKGKAPMTRKEEYAALEDAYNMVYEKKKDSDKCGEDTYWDKEEKKCKSKKSSKSSGRTSIIVGHGYPGYGGGGGGSDNDGDTDGGDGGDGGGGGGGE